MRVFVFALIAVSLSAFAVDKTEAPKAAAQATAPAPVPALQLAAKSYLLLDVAANQVLVAHNVDERMEPASLTKLMTAYLAFDALKNNKLSLTQTLPVSERAWKAQGSRMFIDLKIPVTVQELLHGMITQSGNDASVALAEGIAGSEPAFAELMNKEAQRLGLKNTHFTNATGLPDPQLYSNATDLATLAAAIMRDFPDRYTLYSLKEYRYNNITQPNRNRLLWLDATVDGMKTGHTDNAGYCLIASAKRGEQRLISVLLGASSESTRAGESQKLLNYGFQNFDSRAVFKKDAPQANLPVYKGKREEIKVGFDRDIFVALPKQDFNRLKSNMTSERPLLAPVSKGQKIGMMKLTLDDKTVAQYPVVALEEVPVAGFFGRTWDSLKLMFK